MRSLRSSMPRKRAQPNSLMRAARFILALPWYGVLGLFVLVVAELLLVLQVSWVQTYFTPIMWTAYILLVDGAVRRLTGSSLITGRTREFVVMVPWSILTWLIFEAYNLHLENWRYSGLATSEVARYLGYVWAFATIMPGVFETADLMQALIGRRLRISPLTPTPKLLYTTMLVGLAMLTLPLLVPTGIARYLFGLVWIGFFLLIEPANYLAGGRSLVGDWVAGEAGRMVGLVLAGVVTGGLWEFWNFWATARWEYTLPHPLAAGPHYFEMPWLGFVGFIPFMIEMFVLFNLLSSLLHKVLPGTVASSDRDDILRAV